MGTHFSSIIGRFRTLSANPDTAVEGDMYWNYVNNALCYYDGSVWKMKAFTSYAGALPSATPSNLNPTHFSEVNGYLKTAPVASLPTSPEDGDFSYDEATDRLYIYESESQRWYYGQFA